MDLSQAAVVTVMTWPWPVLNTSSGVVLCL